MKIQLLNYEFNNIANTITFLDYATIRLDSILLITNVTSNVIIYNFADPTKGGTVLNNVLTLTYNVSAMGHNDSLQIFYDNGLADPTLVETTTAFNEESIWLLRRMVKLIESKGTVDAQMRQRVSADNLIYAWPTVYPVASGTNYPTSAYPQYVNTVYYQPTWAGPVDPRWTNLEFARLAYNKGIRRNLIFT